jgi:hypothetical protein
VRLGSYLVPKVLDASIVTSIIDEDCLGLAVQPEKQRPDPLDQSRQHFFLIVYGDDQRVARGKHVHATLDNRVSHAVENGTPATKFLKKLLI